MRFKTALSSLCLAAVLASAAQAAAPAEQAAGISPEADPARIGAPAGTASGELATLTGALSKGELGYRLTTEDGRSYVLDVSDAQRDLDELVGSSVRLTGMLVTEPSSAPSGSSGAGAAVSADKLGVIRVNNVESAERKAEEP